MATNAFGFITKIIDVNTFINPDTTVSFDIQHNVILIGSDGTKNTSDLLHTIFNPAGGTTFDAALRATVNTYAASQGYTVVTNRLAVPAFNLA